MIWQSLARALTIFHFHPKMKNTQNDEIWQENCRLNLGLSQSLNYFFIFHPKAKNSQNYDIWRYDKTKFCWSFNYFFTLTQK